jgi:hypothetical protein
MYALSHLSVFIILLIPFSIWNLNNHGVFKPTPLEGGAGVAHMGFWSHKLPRGYINQYYWYNTTGYDLLNPFHYSDTVLSNNTYEFEKEWKDVNLRLSDFITQKDSIYLKLMNTPQFANTFPIYNSKYTTEREKLLWEKFIQNVKKDPEYFFTTRVFTFFRLYVTGIDAKKLKESLSVTGKINVLYPFFITLSSIFFGLILSTFYLVNRRFKIEKEFLILYCLAIYFGFIHIPFVIQSRYTIPVQLIIIALSSYIITNQVIKRSKQTMDI